MIGMIIQSQAESAKINAICRTSRESRGIVEDWVDVDGWGEVAVTVRVRVMADGRG